ncbi:hypothetical protein HZB88_00130 [archaeon]|nr:hypothetical protein [archaeon]
MQELAEAKREHQRADHIVYMTYPLIKETKLLGYAIEGTYKAALKAVEALIRHEQEYKRLPAGRFDAELGIQAFREHCMQRYKFDRKLLNTLLELKMLSSMRAQSPIEFSKREQFIICTKEYQTRIIELQKVKQYLNDVRELMTNVEAITNAGDR